MVARCCDAKALPLSSRALAFRREGRGTGNGVGREEGQSGSTIAADDRQGRGGTKGRAVGWKL